MDGCGHLAGSVAPPDSVCGRSGKGAQEHIDGPRRLVPNFFVVQHLKAPDATRLKALTEVEQSSSQARRVVWEQGAIGHMTTQVGGERRLKRACRLGVEEFADFREVAAFRGDQAKKRQALIGQHFSDETLAEGEQAFAKIVRQQEPFLQRPPVGPYGVLEDRGKQVFL